VCIWSQRAIRLLERSTTKGSGWLCNSVLVQVSRIITFNILFNFRLRYRVECIVCYIVQCNVSFSTIIRVRTKFLLFRFTKCFYSIICNTIITKLDLYGYIWPYLMVLPEYSHSIECTKPNVEINSVQTT
jgi:hypothetical protein